MSRHALVAVALGIGLVCFCFLTERNEPDNQAVVKFAVPMLGRPPLLRPQPLAPSRPMPAFAPVRSSTLVPPSSLRATSLTSTVDLTSVDLPTKRGGFQLWGSAQATPAPSPVARTPTHFIEEVGDRVYSTEFSALTLPRGTIIRPADGASSSPTLKVMKFVGRDYMGNLCYRVRVSREGSLQGFFLKQRQNYLVSLLPDQEMFENVDRVCKGLQRRSVLSVLKGSELVGYRGSVLLASAPAIVYEDGETLEEFLASPQAQSVTSGDMDRVIQDLLAAVSELHDNGIAHCFISPQTVFVSRDRMGRLRAKVLGIGVNSLHNAPLEDFLEQDYESTAAPTTWSQVSSVGDVWDRASGFSKRASHGSGFDRLNTTNAQSLFSSLKALDLYSVGTVWTSLALGRSGGMFESNIGREDKQRRTAQDVRLAVSKLPKEARNYFLLNDARMNALTTLLGSDARLREASGPVAREFKSQLKGEDDANTTTTNSFAKILAKTEEFGSHLLEVSGVDETIEEAILAKELGERNALQFLEVAITNIEKSRAERIGKILGTAVGRLFMRDLVSILRLGRPGYLQEKELVDKAEAGSELARWQVAFTMAYDQGFRVYFWKQVLRAFQAEFFNAYNIGRVLGKNVFLNFEQRWVQGWLRGLLAALDAKIKIRRAEITGGRWQPNWQDIKSDFSASLGVGMEQLNVKQARLPSALDRSRTSTGLPTSKDPPLPYPVLEGLARGAPEGFKDGAEAARKDKYELVKFEYWDVEDYQRCWNLGNRTGQLQARLLGQAVGLTLGEIVGETVGRVQGWSFAIVGYAYAAVNPKLRVAQIANLFKRMVQSIQTRLALALAQVKRSFWFGVRPPMPGELDYDEGKDVEDYVPELV